jgi:hypothetical protein
MRTSQFTPEQMVHIPRIGDDARWTIEVVPTRRTRRGRHAMVIESSTADDVGAAPASEAHPEKFPISEPRLSARVRTCIAG